MGVRPITNGVAGPYVWKSYNEVFVQVKNFGSGLAKRKLLSPNSNVALFSINRPEWVIAEQACFMFGWVTVPLYDTLGPEAIEYIVNLTEISVVVATADKAKVLIDIASKVKTVKTIVVMDTANEDLKSAGSKVGITVLQMDTVELEGAQSPSDGHRITKDTVATICFTSGTTGLPKGALLTHENILSFVAGATKFADVKALPRIRRDDCHISYLPLAHVFERIVQAAIVNAGGRIGFYQGDTLKLLEDVAELKPTIFASVPRLYNRIYGKVLAKVNSGSPIVRALFNFAYRAKKHHLASGYVTHSVWDPIVFAGVRARLGGRVRWMLCGAAPISAEVVDFLRICFSTTFTEGYGQTETTGGATVTLVDDTTSGHVGVPMPASEVKLVDVPEMQYSSNDKPFPRGEICIRGHAVFKGYYKEPKKTAEALDADGWCHTGDIGLWDARGRLKIIDRAKHIFKLSQGEYVAPEKIEIVYQRHELVAQAFVYGDSIQSTIVAVIVPNEETFLPWASKQGFNSKSLEDLCKNDEVKKAVLKAITDFGKANGLKGFENVKNIHLSATLFSVENNILSPTFKLKRHEAKKVYSTEIEQMYLEITTE